jgi:hypothetical protein
MVRPTLSALLFLAALASPGSARADEPEEPKPRANAFLIYPVALPIGRLSVAYQRSIAGGHTLALGVFGEATGFLIPTGGNAMAGAGGEISYLYYLRGGLSGFFLGPSIGVGRFYYADTITPKQIWYGDLSISKDSGFFTSLEAGFDVGYLYMFKNGGLLGGGLGAQYNIANKTREEMSGIAYLIAGTGVRPRVLLIVGAAL